MTAVIRFAEASRAALIMIRSSTRFRSTGSHADWTMKRSAPRTESSYRQYVSPFANVFSFTSPSSMSSCSAMRWARSGFERPANNISRFCGASASARPTSSSGCGVTPPSPGRACSIVPLSTAPFLVHLLRPGDRKRARRYILCDDGAGCNPCVVADRDGGDKGIVDTRPDVAPDRRPELLSRRVILVHRDRPCTDVRVLADVGVPDVRQVRHFGPLPDARVLDLDERPGFRSCLEDRSRPEVAEGPDQRPLAHGRVDD